MSTERIIHLADLTFIYNSLRSLSNDIGTVSSQVDQVGQEVLTTRSDLARLEQAFLDFVAADARAKEIALAETRLVKIRQDLENRFGYYAEVRRHATGILQAADVSIVRQETVKSATENLMLAAPRYWLAPALVALAGWLADQRELAEKALAEALRRDDEKTSLFFALIARRANRTQACKTWLDRYFGMQDPTRLDRQSVVLIDALASGVFGAEVRSQCARRIEGWIEELAQRAGFLEQQRRQWTDALRSKMPALPHRERYRHLAQYSPTWPKIEESLNGAALHAVVRDHFQNIFAGALPPSPNLQAAVDELLDTLVKRFDDEELPLRRDEELCRLIIETDGDKAAARQRYALESQALEETVDFTQLLTNAAMHPELAHASRATQRLAIALSRNWIKDAHQDLCAQLRAAVPGTVTLSIEDWQGQSQAGENEAELAAALSRHIEKRRDAALSGIKLGLAHWAALVIGIGLVFSAFSAGFIALALGAGCLIWFFVARNNVRKARERLKADFARLQEQSLAVLRAALAELVETRRDLAQRDAVADEVRALLEAISPEQYVLSPHDGSRTVLA